MRKPPKLPPSVFPEDVIYGSGKKPEVEALHRAYCAKLVDRLLAHPELVPFGNTPESIRQMLTNGWLEIPENQTYGFEVESYFERKEELAAQGVKVFNADIEHSFSSEQVQSERAQQMIAYLLQHEELLPALSITTATLADHDYTRKRTYFLAKAWCFVCEQEVAGVELMRLPASDERRLQFSELLQPLSLSISVVEAQ